MTTERVIVKVTIMMGSDISGIGVGSFRTCIDVEFADIVMVQIDMCRTQLFD